MRKKVVPSHRRCDLFRGRYGQRAHLGIFGPEPTFVSPGEHDLRRGAQSGRRRQRLRQGPFLPLLPLTMPPLRPGTPQKVMLSYTVAM
jgi:hypothetical protein